jgi:hypothetical protein
MSIKIVRGLSERNIKKKTKKNIVIGLKTPKNIVFKIFT